MRVRIAVIAVASIGLFAACGERGQGAAVENVSPSSTTQSVREPETSPPSAAVNDDELPRVGEEDVAASDLAAVEVTGLDGDTVTVHIGPRPSGQSGVCFLDAWSSLSDEVKCFEPDSAGQLRVPIRSDVDVQVFIDQRVSRIVLQTGADSEELTLYPVPGVPDARLFATRIIDPGDDEYLELRDRHGDALEWATDWREPAAQPGFAVQDVPYVEVTAIGGETVKVQVGPRPSNEPGVCVVETWTGQPEVACLAPDADGTLWFDILGEISVSVFINPQAVTAVLVNNDGEQQFTLQPVPGVPDAFVIAQKIPPDDVDPGVLRFLDASGLDVDTADAHPYGNCAVFDRAVEQFGPLLRTGSCRTPSFEQEPVVPVGESEEFVVVEVPSGMTVRSDDVDLVQKGPLVKILQLTGRITLTLTANGNVAGEASFDLEDIPSSLESTYSTTG